MLRRGWEVIETSGARGGWGVVPASRGLPTARDAQRSTHKTSYNSQDVPTTKNSLASNSVEWRNPPYISTNCPVCLHSMMRSQAKGNT